MANLNLASVEAAALARGDAWLPSADEPSWSGHCRTTRWSVILAAAAGGESARVALGRLYRAYWHPVFAAVAKRRGYDAALELTQAFFVKRLVEANDLERVACRPGGRFRGWLFAALRCFLINQLKFERQKCRDARRTVALEGDANDHEFSAPILVLADTAPDPERQLRRKEALNLLSQVLQRLRQEYCAHAASAGVNAEQRFEAVKVFLPGTTTDIAKYRNVAVTLGLSSDALKQLVRRMRLRFCQLLDDEIMKSVTGEADTATAKRLLCEALSESIAAPTPLTPGRAAPSYVEA